MNWNYKPEKKPYLVEDSVSTDLAWLAWVILVSMIIVGAIWGFR